jgi:hypothetical protein
MIAAGRGPARIPTCEHVLRDVPTKAFSLTTNSWQPLNCCSVVVRALSFLGPSELRALRVLDPGIFGSVLSMPSEALDALNSLRAVEVETDPLPEDESHAAAIIERCAARVTELQGPLPVHLMCEPDASGSPPLLARCTRLELLKRAADYTPAVWLGLSQLHTLHAVDLSKVSMAAIAAALPRLHTLTTFGLAITSVAVAGFFTDLLPRLRVFHFFGMWPVEAEACTVAAVAAPIAPPLPLPYLDELRFLHPKPDPAVVDGFMGAQPRVLHAPYEMITQCLSSGGGRLLARVRMLHVFARVDVSGLATVLRAAPQLRTFHTEEPLGGDTSWLTASAVPIGPAFAGLVHPWLRYFTVGTASASVEPTVTTDRDQPCLCDDGCVSRLRRCCFPRLQALEVNGKTFFATSADTDVARSMVDEAHERWGAIEVGMHSASSS